MKNKKLIQIGIMGSDADLNDGSNLQQLAFEIGQEIVRSGAVMLVSGEKRGGLTKRAAEGAIAANGVVIGVMGNRKSALSGISAVIDIGTNREGLREFFLVNSCDVIIAIGGGSGTLNELTIAYQNLIPVVCITKGSGWAVDLAGKFLDKRKFFAFEKAETASEAVQKAIALARKR